MLQIWNTCSFLFSNNMLAISLEIKYLSEWQTEDPDQTASSEAV